MQIEDLRKHWKIVLVLATLPFAYLLGERMGDISLSKSWFLWGMMAMLIYFGNSLWSSWRYSTRAFVCPTLHKSVKAPFYTIGDWAVVPVGSVDAEGFSWEGGEGTVVVPRESVETHPEFIVSWSQPQVVALEELPMEVQSFVRDRRSCGRPYYFSVVNLKPTRFETFYKAVIDKIPNPPTKEELQKTVQAELQKLSDKFKEETTGYTDKFVKQAAVTSTFDNLLGQLTKGGGRIFDFIGSAERTMRKKSFFDLIKREEERKKVAE